MVGDNFGELSWESLVERKISYHFHHYNSELIGLLGMSGAHPYLAMSLEGVISAWVGYEYKIAPHFSGWFLSVVPQSL